MQNYKISQFVNENYRKPVNGKFADDAEKIPKIIGAQKAA